MERIKVEHNIQDNYWLQERKLVRFKFVYYCLPFTAK
jgi:hypothetical protein